MLKTALITLQPLGAFYFGGDVTFGIGERKNYFVRSEKFPQQTALLGMLRYQLLVENDLLPLHKGGNAKKAEGVIGSKSFDGITTDFGAIKGLSPIFLRKGDTSYFQSPKENVKGDVLHLTVKTTGKAYRYDQEEKPLYSFLLNEELSKGNEYISAKDTVITKYMPPLPTKGDKEEVEVDPYVEEEHVGIIKKGRVGEGKVEDGFYRQVMYRLNEGWSFAFYVQYDSSISSFKNGLVTLGGERSMFEMSVKESDKDTDKPPQELFINDYKAHYINHSLPKEMQKLVLLSAAYVKGTLPPKLVMIKRAIPLRHLITNLETKSWHRLHNKESNENTEKKIEKSARRLLIEAGAVFYGKEGEIEQLKQCLDCVPAYKLIGYNQYLTFNHEAL